MAGEHDDVLHLGLLGGVPEESCLTSDENHQGQDVVDFGQDKSAT